MKTWIRRGLIGLATLAALGAATIATGAWRADQRAARHIDVQAAPVALRSDTAAVERGGYLYRSRGCADCHGADGAGRSFVKADGLHLAGSNISPGPGSAVAAYRPQDRVRILRHGVKPDGRPLRVMPFESLGRLSDIDTHALHLYLKSLASS